MKVFPHTVFVNKKERICLWSIYYLYIMFHITSLAFHLSYVVNVTTCNYCHIGYYINMFVYIRSAQEQY